MRRHFVAQRFVLLQVGDMELVINSYTTRTSNVFLINMPNNSAHCFYWLTVVSIDTPHFFLTTSCQ